MKIKDYFKKLLIRFHRQLSTPKGFTLIELIVVFSIIVFLSTVGLASYFSYSQVQILTSSANEFVTTIQLAKSRANSQVKPPERYCSGQLDGYSVVINITNREYRLGVICGGNASNNPLLTKILPRDITFDEVTTTNIFFPIIQGGVQGFGRISIMGYGRTKTITINSVGIIKVE